MLLRARSPWNVRWASASLLRGTIESEYRACPDAASVPMRETARVVSAIATRARTATAEPILMPTGLPANQPARRPAAGGAGTGTVHSWGANGTWMVRHRSPFPADPGWCDTNVRVPPPTSVPFLHRVAKRRRMVGDPPSGADLSTIP